MICTCNKAATEKKRVIELYKINLNLIQKNKDFMFTIKYQYTPPFE